MKKESNYIITSTPFVNNLAIVNRRINNGNKNPTPVIIAINSSIHTVITNATPVLESDLDIYRQFATETGIELTFTRIKRKYVRKNTIVEPVIIPTPVVEPIEELYGSFIGIGTIINLNPLFQNNAHILKVVRITKNMIYFVRNFDNKGDYSYSITTVNSNLHVHQWVVINPTPEVIKRIGVFNNIVRHNDMKRHNDGFILSIKKNNNTVNITIAPGITGNCQLTVVGAMCNLISYSSNCEAQIREIFTIGRRNLILCDLNKNWYDKLEKILPKKMLHSVTPYKSTNGSNMVICILKNV